MQNWKNLKEEEVSGTFNIQIIFISKHPFREFIGTGDSAFIWRNWKIFDKNVASPDLIGVSELFIFSILVEIN